MIIDLSSQSWLPDGLQLLATPITPMQSRREAETSAVGRLVQHAFGREATLNHRHDGSPVVIGINMEISISHSRTHAFLAISSSTARIGIDAEQPRKQLVRVAHKFLSSDEISKWTTPPQLLLAWTIKEAVYKAAATQGLPLAHIALPTDTPIASIPDGRRFRIHTTSTPTHTITIATPLQ